jgi:hypothetical protein
MTRPSVLGDVSGLSPGAIEALPAADYKTDAEERITITTSLLVAWGGAVTPIRQEQVLSALQALLNRRHAPLTGSDPNGHDA